MSSIEASTRSTGLMSRPVACLRILPVPAAELCVHVQVGLRTGAQAIEIARFKRVLKW